MTQVTIHGPNGEPADVVGKKLQVNAISQTQLENISAEQGQAFSYTSTFVANSGEEVMTIQNTAESKHMHIDQVWVGAADLALFVIGRVTSGTPAGTVITGSALNQDLNRVAPSTAFGNASVTGTVVVRTQAHLQVPADQTILFDLEGAWVYGKDDMFGVRVDTGTTVFVTVILHFDDID